MMVSATSHSVVEASWFMVWVSWRTHMGNTGPTSMRRRQFRMCLWLLVTLIRTQFIFAILGVQTMLSHCAGTTRRWRICLCRPMIRYYCVLLRNNSAGGYIGKLRRYRPCDWSGVFMEVRTETSLFLGYAASTVRARGLWGTAMIQGGFSFAGLWM